MWTTFSLAYALFKPRKHSVSTILWYWTPFLGTKMRPLVGSFCKTRTVNRLFSNWFHSGSTVFDEIRCTVLPGSCSQLLDIFPSSKSYLLVLLLSFLVHESTGVPIGLANILRKGHHHFVDYFLENVVYRSVVYLLSSSKSFAWTFQERLLCLLVSSKDHLVYSLTNFLDENGTFLLWLHE